MNPTKRITSHCIQNSGTIRALKRAPTYSLLGLVVAHLQGGVVVNEWGFEFIDSDPVDAALFTVKLDPVQVDHCGEDGQLNKALKEARERDKRCPCEPNKSSNMYRMKGFVHPKSVPTHSICAGFLTAAKSLHELEVIGSYTIYNQYKF